MQGTLSENLVLKNCVWGTDVKLQNQANDKIVLAHVWSQTQKISQERSYPDLGQDNKDCKKHLGERTSTARAG